MDIWADQYFSNVYVFDGRNKIGSGRIQKSGHDIYTVEYTPAGKDKPVESICVSAGEGFSSILNIAKEYHMKNSSL